uniref:Reverse transcriptase domain-containing protein n=1 Tax=Tanacetum cinerariifolium TaxID=118510 RepID=A0A6L2KSB3_TANCI|nr:reverse transcriptase domain-containing protein [Tanacetum cinerariifolium]
MADRTMEELFEAPTEGYGEAIVILEILAENFEIKTNLLQDVLNDAIKLMLFPYSLEGAARIWDNVSKTDDRTGKLTDQILNLVEIVNKQVITPASAKAVEKTCVTCGGAHAYYDCIATDGNQSSVCATTGSYNQNNVLRGDFNKQEENPRRNLNNDMRSILGSFFQNQASTSGTFPSNTVPNPKGEMKVVTARSSLAYEGPSIPTNSPLEKVVEQDTEEITDKEHSNCQGSTAQVQPSVVPISISKPNVPRTQLKPTILYHSRSNDQKLREKATNQMVKFFQIFHDLHFDISFADTLLLMPKFASTIKSLLMNKDKLFELVKVLLNENCSAMLFIKLPENLGDPDVIDIACEEFVQDVLDFQYNPKSSNPTLVSENDFRKEPIVKFSSPTLTPFREKLPSHLQYAFLEDSNKLPVIIAKDLKNVEKEALIKVLKSHKRAIAWKIFDIKGIDPRFYTHKSLMKEDYKPAVQSQRRVNPKIHDVIKKEVIKLLNVGMIYPISDSPWVSPIYCVPKKGGMTVVANENNELIPMRLVTNWRVCIDYRKLNDATRKEHFLLPFMDQMLKRLAKKEFYYLLDGFSGCMMAIFHDMIEKTMEVFMDDFSVFGDSFSSCLTNLDKMLKHCEETNLVLNWEKCHFMRREGIVLGHKISKSGIEVDRVKVDVIAKLPYPTTFKGVRSFLGYAGFYRRFIQDFSKIARPMTYLLEKETPFVFSKECVDVFNTLKKKLTEAMILVVPDWNLPFELMCDASDFAIGAVLGQRKMKHFQPIHYASKTMTEAQIHYTTTEKEMLAVVYAFEKFWPKLILSKSIVYTDHSSLKYFLNKQDAKPRLLRCVLLLQEFDITILDKKESKNLVADHLSRLENPHKDMLENKDINENFPLETLGILSCNSTSWFVDIVEAKALLTNDASVVKFLKSLFSRFGIPRAIISDHGTHLCNDQFPRVMIKYGVTHRLATAYHPQTSGQVEVSNHRLKRILERTVGENRASWTKKLHDSKIKNRIFNVGDQVLLFNSYLKIFSRKLKTRWSGPFTITQVFLYGTEELSQPNGLNFKVNDHRVMHYFGGDIPSKLFLHPSVPNPSHLTYTSHTPHTYPAGRINPSYWSRVAICVIYHSQLNGSDQSEEKNLEAQRVPKVDDVSLVDKVFNGVFGGYGEEDIVMGEGVVVASSSLEMLTKSCVGGMMLHSQIHQIHGTDPGYGRSVSCTNHFPRTELNFKGNSQVKDNKNDLLIQQYEKFTILEEESIDSGFARFITIIANLKALDDGFSSKNYVRNFFRALHPIWRAKVKAIKESKDLSSLALDELISNLKVHEVVMEKDSEIYRGKKERVKSIALKAKKESSDDETLTSRSDDKEYAMAVRNFKKFFKRKDAVIQIMSLAIVQNHLATKIKRPSLEVLGVIAKMTPKTKPTMKLVSWLNRRMSANSLKEMLNNKKSPSCKIGLGFDDSKASTSGTKNMSFVESSVEKEIDGSTIKVNGSTLPGSKLIHNSIDKSKKLSLKPSPKSDIDEWIKDSGFSKHMTGNKSLFSTYKAYDKGLQIKQIEDEIFFNQSKHIKEMLKKFRLEDSKPTKTQMSTEIKLTKDNEADSMDSSKYRGTKIETIVYADSDHACDYVNRKSTSGVCTFMGCCFTSWFAKKQTTLAISTTEAKYVSAEKACQQALWMKQALIDYDIHLDNDLIM